MATIRSRLTAWYSAALLVSLLAFATSLYLDRRVSSVRELDERLALEVDFSVSYLENSYRVLGKLVRIREGIPQLDPGIANFFEGTTSTEYVLVTDSAGNVLFSSEPAARLGFSSFQRLRAPLVPVPSARSSGTFTFDPDIGPVRYVIVPVREAGPEIAAVIVTAGDDAVLFGPGALLRSMLISLPLILGASIWLGYRLAGPSLKPLTTMRREIEAISDGQSLHRRLLVDSSDPQMAGLAASINRMFARLEGSFTALHRFTADASHELKTPLMVLRSGVERALTHPDAPPESIEALDQTLEGVNAMTELVDNLLTLARADEGRAPLALTPVDLRELVTDTAETAGMLAETSGITVTFEVPEEPVVVPVDRSRILQLLLNLATNAVKYTPSGGQVGIELTATETTVELVVRDTGIGIAPGDLPHVFDRFWRADVARSRSGGPPGTGLGLAITKWIAEAHGGRIEAQSRPGRGTQFTVTLPRETGTAVQDPDSVK